MAEIPAKFPLGENGIPLCLGCNSDTAGGASYVAADVGERVICITRSLTVAALNGIEDLRGSPGSC